MALRAWFARGDAQPGAPGARAARISREEWRQVAEDCGGRRRRLLALWASRTSVHARRSCRIPRRARAGSCEPAAAGRASAYPGIEDLFPAPARMQRALADLSGMRSQPSAIRARGCATPHGPQSFHPLIEPQPPPPAAEPAIDDYAFVACEGDGVHEIPVGPVHAGIIEPGHFRFSVVGEKVLRLEERLGYVHKGIERRFTELPLLEGHRLAARVSGDSAVAFSWAYCQALEGMAGAHDPAARRVAAGALPSSSSGWPTISAISARSATTPASPSVSRSSPV